MKTSAALKVGLLSILSLFILIFGIMWLKGRSLSIGEKTEVHFKDIDGMRPGSAVRMMGMRIGQVDEIEPVIDGENSYVVIKFVINEQGINIPTASKISIQQSGIIGEKFLEITPPFPETVIIPLEKNFKGEISKGAQVELLVGGKYIKVGQIKESKIMNTKSLPLEERRNIKTFKICKIKYFVNVPEIEIPKNSQAVLVKANKKREYLLRFTPPKDVIIKMPDPTSKYTIVEPLRMKDFLDVQLQAALALKETNDKINNLFTDEFMNNVRYTFENTKDLTEKVSIIMDQVAEIVDSSKDDIKNLISSATSLSKNMTVLSKSLNDIVEDPEFKTSLISTVTSIKTTSDNLSVILANSKIQDSLLNINSTTQNVSEVAQYVNNLTQDKEFTKTVGESVANLNEMMMKLSAVADSLDDVTVEQKDKIKEIIDNSSDASKDLKKFSKKLNQRFLLLKLLFQ